MARTKDRYLKVLRHPYEPVVLLRKYRAAGYLRLSEDSERKQSDSIENQRYMINQYAKEHEDIEIVMFFEDDGFTGTNFHRSGFEQMMDAVRNGEIDCIIVKDVSRFGREHIQVGDYIDKVFPFLGVRFISIMDYYDSINPDCDRERMILSIKSLVHEMYPRDISRKVHSTFRAKRERGEVRRSNGIPYGFYMEAGDTSYRIDYKTYRIYKKIVGWYVAGCALKDIVRLLFKRGILTPSQYEFDNVALPEDFLSLLSTMRSRNISSVIIIQDLSQIKTRYKDGEHEKIMANCDTMIYLGGNGPGTQKELSELMGKATIDKRTNGETLGKQGNSTRNYDVLGRELMFPDELRKIEGNKCILFIRGFDPVLDNKIESKKHPLWNLMCDAQKGELFDARIERLRKMKSNKQKNSIGFVDEAELAHLELLEKKEKKHYEDERRVAELLGTELPETPQQYIFRLDYEELDQLAEQLKEAPAGKIVLDQKLIQKAKEDVMQQVEFEAEKQAYIKQNQIDVREFQTPEEALAFSALKRKNFSNPQIKILLQLVREDTVGMDLDAILETFDSKMDMETIEMMTEMLL